MDEHCDILAGYCYHCGNEDMNPDDEMCSQCGRAFKETPDE